MDNLVDQLVTTGVGEALLGFVYFLWVLTGIVNAAVNTKTWSWKKFFADLSKAFIMAAVILGLVVVSNGMEWFAGMLGFDISPFTDGMSTVTILGGITGGIALYYGKAVKNALNFFKLDTSVAKLKEGIDKPNYKAIAEPTMEVVNGIVEKLFTPETLAAEHEAFEQEGGRGAVYTVPIGSYAAFRAYVMGKGFDIDGAWGYQCWDGCALLWQQLGLSLITGNGCAYGCWTLKKDVNKYDKFELITDKTKIKKGDVLVFGGSQFGHIGYADEDYNNPNYIKLLGQNQGGTPVGAGGGAGFNVINMSLANFLGAFRYKGWETKPAPTAPADKIQETIDNVRKDEDDHGDFKVGDKVVPIEKVDYDGRKLRQYDEVYTITSISGNRAVLSARGQIWAAMNTNNIKHA